MKYHAKKNRNSGLTLMETLAVVAIIVILIGVSAVAVVRHLDYLNINELDNAAREIYMAAQNRAVLLSGNQTLFDLVYIEEDDGPGIPVDLSASVNHKGSGDDPSTISLLATTGGDEVVRERLFYLSAEQIEEEGYVLLDTENIDSTLLARGDFYIVYDLTSGSVTDVIYAEKGSLDKDDIEQNFEKYHEEWWTLDQADRVKVKRSGNGPLVGWYGGEAPQGSRRRESSGQPIIDIEIDNKEVLTVTVTVYYTEADDVTDEIRSAVEAAIRDDEALYVILGPVDGSSGLRLGTRSDPRLDADPGDDGFSDEGYFTRTWILDSLEKDTNGSYKYKFDDLNYTGVTPGENFMITASFDLDEDSILEIDPVTKINNSLFAYIQGESGGDTAYIEYLRHLQNLDKDGDYRSGVNGATKAVQIATIMGGNNYDNGYAFIPIVNRQLTLYNGSYELYKAANGEGSDSAPVYEIRNLKVDASQPGASGLFGQTRDEGMEFRNMRLVNITAQATGTGSSVGALAGETYGDTVIDNCWVYWEQGDGVNLDNALGLGEYGDPEDYEYRLTGGTVGGLVGTANGRVEITGSLAASTVEGAKYAGGLVGQMKAEGNTIKNSYADCYLTGSANAHVAGLVGDVQKDVTLKKCYSAGFVLGVEKPEPGFIAAGLCLGEQGNSNKITVNNVYSAVMYPDFSDGKSITGRDDKIYGLTNIGLSSESTNYIYLGEQKPGEDKTTSATMSADIFIDTMNAGTSEDGEFVRKTGQTHAYDLRLYQSLKASVYSYPGLKGLDHYGDWGTEFKDPSLVYYEKYNAISTDAWGISGGNARNLLNVNNLNDNRTVLSDGYAVAFLVTDFNLDEFKDINIDTVKVKYNYTDLVANDLKIATINGEPATIETTVTVGVLKDEQQTKWESDGVWYNAYVIPLPDELVYSDFALDCFYRYVGFELYFVDSVSSIVRLRCSGEYLFNPHFAEAIDIYDDGSGIDWTKGELPSRVWDDDMENKANTKANTMGSVTIRTPRHLFDLSEFSEYYSSPKRYTFSQTLGLNYLTYDWRGVNDPEKTVFELTATDDINAIITNTELNKGILAKPYEQSPIGLNETLPFTGAYEGGYNYIKNVLPNVKLLGTENRYMGLFGYSTVRLRNIVYQMGPDKDNNNEALYQMITNPLKDITNNLYIGGLVGANTGTITNCAVHGVDLKTDISGVKLYVGALVGLNNGSISSCSAESNKLAANAYNYSELYMGGLVGENSSNRSINSSYAVGRINIEVNNTKTAQICGFAGKNSGTITDAYAAVDLESSGLGVDPYGFCNEEDSESAQLSGSIGYLDQGSYTYRDISYAANYKPEVRTETANAYKYDELSEYDSGMFVKFPNMGKASNAPQTDNNSYPFPAVVKDGDGKDAKYIHYGQVPDLLDILDMGVFYWEVLKIDGKETYHISALAVNGTTKSITEVSTLSEAHDDGGVITKYGYGYYYNKDADPPAFEATNIGYFSYVPSDETNRINSVESLTNAAHVNGNTDVNNALEKMLSGYKVIAWNTYHEGGHGADWGHVNGNGKNYGTERQRKATAGLAPRSTWDPNATGGTGLGKFTLTKDNGKSSQVKVEFVIDPHFAASMSVNSVREGNGNNPQNVINTWVAQKDRSKLTTVPGTSSDNPFQVRCGTQLQDINVSTRLYTDMCIGSGGQGATTSGSLWNLPTAQYFPYLSSINLNTSNASIIAYPSNHNTYGSWNKYYRYYYFEQTHDMDWTGEGNTYEEDGVTKPGVFTPIAAASTRSGNDGSNHIQLPGWFSGSYEGNSYTLKNFNIDINTEQYNTSCMGLFGAINTNANTMSNSGTNNNPVYKVSSRKTTTVLQNIVMYSETGTDTITVRGRSVGISNDSNVKGGGAWSSALRWYAGGVLVGVSLGQSEIINCAVAGYTIVDATRTAGDNLYTSNPTTNYGPDSISASRIGSSNTNNTADNLGGAIGGLVGLTDGPLKGCVAVTTIILEPNHSDLSPGDGYTGSNANWSNSNASYDMPTAYSGGKDSPVRVGGLVGTTTSTVENCYTGGTVEFSQNADKTIKAKSSTIYIGRIIGGVGAGPFVNKNDITASNVSIKSCYSYMSLPEKVSITRTKKNHNSSTNYTETADGSRDIVTYNIGGQGAGPENASNLTSNYYLENVGYAATVTGTNTGISVSYLQLSGKDQISDKDTLVALGGAYDWVSKAITASDGINKLDVPGRFSYVPSGSEYDKLRGQDFPFPTVLTQPADPSDPNSAKYNVHYGGWTLYGIERYKKVIVDGKEIEKALGAQPIEVDIFSDQGMYDELLRLSDKVPRGGTWKVKVEPGDAEYITATFGNDSVLGDEKDAQGNTIYIVYTMSDTNGEIPLYVTALKPNNTPAKVYIEYVVGGVTYDLPRPIDVNVTAKVELVPGRLDIYPGEEVRVKLTPSGIPEGTQYILNLGDSINYSTLLLGYKTTEPQIIRLAADFGADDNEDTVWVDVPYTFSVSEAEDAYKAEETHGIFANLKYLNRVGKWEGDKDGNWKWTIDLKEYIPFTATNAALRGITHGSEVNDNVFTLTVDKDDSFPSTGSELTITTDHPEDGIESRKLTINIPAPIDLAPDIKWNYEKPDEWILDFSKDKFDTLTVKVEDLTGSSTFEQSGNIVTISGVTMGTDIVLNVELTKNNINLVQTCIKTITLPEPIESLNPAVKWDDKEVNCWVIDFSEKFDTLVGAKSRDDNSPVTITALADGSASAKLTLVSDTDVLEGVDLEVTLTKGKLTQTSECYIFLPKATAEVDSGEVEDPRWIIKFGGDTVGDSEFEATVKAGGVTPEIRPGEDDNSITLTLKKDTEDPIEYPLQVMLKGELSRGGKTENCELTVNLPEFIEVKPEAELVEKETDKWEIIFGDGVTVGLVVEATAIEISDGSDTGDGSEASDINAEVEVAEDGSSITLALTKTATDGTPDTPGSSGSSIQYPVKVKLEVTLYKDGLEQDQGQYRILTIVLPDPQELNPAVKWNGNEPDSWTIDFNGVEDAEDVFDTLVVTSSDEADDKFDIIADSDDSKAVTISLRNDGEGDTTENEAPASVDLKVTLTKDNAKWIYDLPIMLPTATVEKAEVTGEGSDSDTWNISFSHDVDADVELKATVLSEGNDIHVEPNIKDGDGSSEGNNTVILSLSKDANSDPMETAEIDYPVGVELEVTLKTQDGKTQTCIVTIELPEPIKPELAAEKYEGQPNSWTIDYSKYVEEKVIDQLKAMTEDSNVEITYPVDGGNYFILTLKNDETGDTSSAENGNTRLVTLDLTLTKGIVTWKCKVEVSLPSWGTVSDGDLEAGQSEENGTQNDKTVTDGDGVARKLESGQSDTQDQESGVSSGNVEAFLPVDEESERKKEDTQDHESGVSGGDNGQNSSGNADGI